MFATSKPMFRAQFTIRVLLEVGLMLIVYSQIYPVLIAPYIEDIICDPTTDSVVAALLSLLPFIMALIIILSVLGFNIMGGRRI